MGEPDRVNLLRSLTPLAAERRKLCGTSVIRFFPPERGEVTQTFRRRFEADRLAGIWLRSDMLIWSLRVTRRQPRIPLMIYLTNYFSAYLSMVNLSVYPSVFLPIYHSPCKARYKQCFSMCQLLIVSERQTPPQMGAFRVRIDRSIGLKEFSI